MSDIHFLEPKKLTPDSVRKLVLEGIDLIKETRDELRLPLFSTIERTGARLENGVFMARRFRPRRLSGAVYAKAYGYFRLPSTIVLEEDLPFEGQQFNQQEVGTTASYYCAVHEVIHADDYTNNNRLMEETLKHIVREHESELDEALKVLEPYSRGRWSRNQRHLIRTWAYQYVDSATHYRTYLVLKHRRFPKIENIWLNLYNSIFSPMLLTTIESTKGLEYTANLLSKEIGKTCIVEKATEYEDISQRKARRYTV